MRVSFGMVSVAIYEVCEAAVYDLRQKRGKEQPVS